MRLLVQQRHQAGRIELTTTPADAIVLVDNVKVGDHSPVSIERPPGPYTLSVTRDGYVRNDQNIELQGRGSRCRWRWRWSRRPTPASSSPATRRAAWSGSTMRWSRRHRAAGARRTSARSASPRAATCSRSGARAGSSPGARTWRSSPARSSKIHATLIPPIGGAPAASGKPAPVAAAPPAGGTKPERRQRPGHRRRPPSAVRPRPTEGRPTTPPAASRPALAASGRRAPTAPPPPAQAAPPRETPVAEGARESSERRRRPRRARRPVAATTARAAATAHHRQLRSPGRRCGSTARTRPSTRRSSTTSSLAASTSSRSSAPTCRSIRPRASRCRPGPEVQAALHAGHRRLSSDSPPVERARTVAEAASSRHPRAGAARPKRSRRPGATSSRARAKRRAHPAARDFLHARHRRRRWPASIPADASVLEAGCGEGDLLAALPNARRAGIDYLPDAIERARARHPDISFEVGDITAAARPPAHRVDRVRDLGRGDLRSARATACSTSRRCSRTQAPAGARRPHLPDRLQLPVGGADAAGGDDRLEAARRRPRTGCPTPTTRTCSTSPAWRSCATRIGCCCRWRCRRCRRRSTAIWCARRA